MTSYRLLDNRAIEYFDDWQDLLSAVEDWYDYLADGDTEFPTFTADPSLSIEELNHQIRQWEEKIGQYLGYSPWYGHGRYFVSAADHAGLSLRAEVVEKD